MEIKLKLDNLFNQQQLDKYCDHLKSNGLSRASIKRKLSSLSSFQKFLVKKKYVNPNPSEKPFGTFQNPLSFHDISLKKGNLLKLPFFKGRCPQGEGVLKPGGFKGFNKYLIIAGLLILLSGLGFGIYSQSIKNAQKNLAYSTAAAPKSPGRQLSFQGRLTDTAGNPIVSSTSIVFRLYDSPTSDIGTSLYTSDTGNSQVVIPTEDDNGIFSVIIGKTHGAAIPSSLFTENTQVFLEITVNGETMTPRQQIATVAYALNSETLQGLPPSASGLRDTVMVLDANGHINLGETTPAIIATNDTLRLEGQGVILSASDGSGGNVTINPDAGGILDLSFEMNAPATGGFVQASADANMTTGNLYFGKVLSSSNNNYNFLDFQNYNVGTTQLASRFSVTAAGNVNVGATLNTSNISINNTLVTSTAQELNLLDGTLATNGSIIVGNGSNLTNLNIGSSGYVLVSTGTTPTWVSSTSVGQVYTAANGLTLNSNAFELGGILNRNTDIGLSGYSLTLSDAGSELVSFNSASTTFNTPANFTSSGDVSIAYDLNFTNPTAAYIKSQSPLYIQTDSPYANLDFTLSAANAGQVIIDDSAQVTAALSVGTTITTTNLFSTGNVGIGTTAPQYRLEVSGSLLTTTLGVGATDPNYPLYTSGKLGVGSTAYFANYVGIGTTSPSHKLEIYNSSALLANFISPDATDDPRIQIQSINANRKWQIRVQKSDGRFMIRDDTSGTFPFHIEAGTLDNTLYLKNSGNVGIGTTNPGARLSVLGDGSSATSDFTLLNNDGSVNLEIRTGLTDLSNTFIGSGVGRVNSTGIFNTALGYQSLYNNTTGNYNTAQGYGSLDGNISGNFNTAIGMYSLHSNTSGSNNTGIGYQALNNSNGSYNTAQGYYAGRKITTGTYNTFLGYGSGDDANQKIDVINSMALGNGAFTTADNQVVIGNDSVTQTLLKGNVGIGTTNPIEKLEIGTAAINANQYVRLLANSGYKTGIKLKNLDDSWGFDIENVDSAPQGLNFVRHENSVAGTSAMFINRSTGNVGIGTTNPGTYALKVMGTAWINSTLYAASLTDANDGNYYLDPNNATTSMIVAGNVGIGTTNPTNKLEVSGGNFYLNQENSVLAIDANQGRLGFLKKSGYAPAIVGGTATAIVFGHSSASDLTTTAVTSQTITENMRIDAAGNIGIGNANPSGKLHVTGGDVFFGVGTSFGIGQTSANTDLRVDGNLSVGGTLFGDGSGLTGIANAGGWTDGGANVFLTTSADNVGIGTSSPTNKLEIKVASGTGGVTTEGIAINDGGATNKMQLFMGVNTTGTYSWIQSALTGNSNKALVLNPDGGNVGIGTTNPLSLLNVNATNVDGSEQLTIGRNSAYHLSLGYSDSGNTNGFIGNNYNSNSARFGIRMKGINDASEVMTFLGSGNVGIGTTNPTYLLDVNGTSGFRNDITITSNNSLFFRDTGNKLFSPATNTLQFSSGAVTTMTMLSGNVGIGNTSPTSLLQLAGSNSILKIGDTAGNSLFEVTDASITSNLPTNFTSSGDVSIAYDLNFTNDTASFIKSAAPLTLEAGDNYESNNLTLKTYNAGKLILDAANLWADGTYFGIGTTNPQATFQVTGGDVLLGSTTLPPTHVSASTDLRVDGNLSVGGTLFAAIDGSISFTDITTGTNTQALMTVGAGSSLSATGTGVINATQLQSATWASPLAIGNGTANSAAFTTLNVGSTAYFANRVGIGTTSPGEVLDVVGNIRSTSGVRVWDTNALKSNLTYTTDAGDLKLYKADLSLGTRIWAGGDSYITGGNVGIGTTDPAKLLQVGSASTDSDGIIRVAHKNTAGGNNRTWDFGTGDGTIFGHDDNFGFYDATGDKAVMILKNSTGYVGIGTTNPQNLLNVFGTAGDMIRLTPSSNDSYGTIGYSNAGATSMWIANTFNNDAAKFGIRVKGSAASNEVLTALGSGNVGIGTTAPNYKLDVNGIAEIYGSNYSYVFQGTSTSGYASTFNMNDTGLYMGHNSASRSLNLQTNSLDRLTILGGGNVGIGTTNPTQKLNVAGNILMENPYKFYLKDTGHYIDYATTADSTDGIGIYGFAGVQLGKNNGGETAIMQVGGYFNSVSHTNVGIGTTNPSGKLNVVGGDVFFGTTAFGVGHTSSSTDLRLDGNLSVGGTLFGDGSQLTGIANAGGWTDGGSNVYLTTTSDNVGIGTSSPTAGYKLDINGNLRVGSTAYFTSNVGIGTGTPIEKLHVTSGFSLLNDVASSTNRNYGPVLWTDRGFGMELGYLGAWGTRIFTRNASENISFGYQSGSATLQSDFTEWGRFMNGNLGIGTTAPGNTLSVYGPSSAGLGSAGNILEISGPDGNNGFQAGANDTGNYSWVQSKGARSFILNPNGGNVGIGTTNPTEKLHINGANPKILLTSTSGSAYQTGLQAFYDYQHQMSLTGMSGTEILGQYTTNTALMYGNVGIGTTNPGAKLDVSGGNIRINNSDTNSYVDYAGARAFTGYSSTTNSLVLQGSSTKPITFNINDTFGSGEVARISTTGNFGIGTTNPGAKLTIAKDFTGTAYYAAQFSLTGATDVLKKINIGMDTTGNFGWIQTLREGYVDYNLVLNPEGGNVGIGTTSPNSLLHLKKAGTGTTGAVITLENGAGGLNDETRLDSILSASGGVTGRLGFIRTNRVVGGDSDIYLSTLSNNVLREAIRIRDDGKIGIGTSSPTSLLQLAGSNSILKIGDTAGNSLFEVTDASITSNLPTNFTSSGDVSIAYDLNFTNPTASYIKSNAPLYIQTEHPSSNIDLTLSAANSGYVIIDDNFQALSDSYFGTSSFGVGHTSTSTDLRVDGNLSVGGTLFGDGSQLTGISTGGGWTDGGSNVYLTTSSDNVGIGTTAPGKKLHVAGSAIIDLYGQGNGSGIFLRNGFQDTYNLGLSVFDDGDGSPDALDINAYDGIYFNTGADTRNPRMVIQSGGNVGIGITAPLSKFVVNTDTNMDFEVRKGSDYGAGFSGVGIDSRDDTRSTRNMMIITGSPIVMNIGNVGIGTTSPTQKLSVSGSIAMTPLAGTNRYILLDDGGNGANYTGALSIQAGGGSVGWGGGLTLYSHSHTTHPGDVVAGISASSGGSFRVNSYGIDGGTDLFTVKQSGNVGIGTTNPLTKLEVKGSLRLSATGNDSLLGLSNDGTTSLINATYLTTGAYTPITFNTSDLERMRISTTGNVGIGTTNPGAKLDVGTDGNTSADFWLTPNRNGLGTSYNWRWTAWNSANNYRLDLQSGTNDPYLTVLNPASGSGGYVGIGTANPAKRLSVQNSAVGTEGIALYRNTGDGTLMAGLGQDADGSGEINAYNTSGTKNVQIRANTASFFNGGNVGIGTTNPYSPLTVVGRDISFGETITLNPAPNGYTTIGMNLVGGSAGTGWYIGKNTNASGGTEYLQFIKGGWTGSSLGYRNDVALAFNPSNGNALFGGNVGIGTTNPLAPLSFANSTGQKVSFWDGNNDRYGVDVQNSELRIYSGAAGDSTGGITFGKFNETTFTEAMRIQNGGNVGIGTTNPHSKLEILGGTSNVGGYGDGSVEIAGTLSPIAFVGQDNLNPGLNRWGIKLRAINEGDFSFYDYTNSAHRLLINSSGNVGIGTTNPAYKLDVNGQINSTGLCINGDCKTSWTGIGGYTASNGLTLVSQDFRLGGTLSQNTDIGFSGFSLIFSDAGSTLATFNSISTTFNNPTNFTSSGDVSIAYDLNFTNDTASFIKSAAPLTLEAGDNYESNNLTLKTYNAGKLILDSANLWADGTNVGIGTTNPANKLEIYAGSDTSQILWGQNIRNNGNADVTNYGAGIKFKISSDSSNEANKWVGLAAVAGTGWSNRTDLAIYVNPTSASAPVEKVRITGDGDVGIGTTSPAGKLQIVGDTYFGNATGTQGALYLYGSTAGVLSRLMTTNGNLHIDAASGGSGIYLNYYSGTGGIMFGNGATGSNANVSAAGAYTGTSLNVGSGTITSGLINGQTISSAANFTGTLVAATSLSAPRLISTVATGTAPLTVTSATKVSNLNSDLLDDRDSTAFAFSETKGGSINLNTITQSGMYRVDNSLTNSPAGLSWGQLIVAHGSADTITQLYGDYGSGNLYTRSGNPPDVGGSGSWSAWHKLWSDQNDGSGSGLDADLLDGHDSSYFMTSSSISGTTNYVSKFTSSTTLGNSLIYDNGTNVGIGTTSPLTELHVNDPTGNSAIRLSGGAGSNETYQLQQGIDGISNGGFAIRDVTNSINRLVIQYSTGNVGIGITVPGAKLHINDSQASDIPIAKLTNTYSNTDYIQGYHAIAPNMGTNHFTGYVVGQDFSARNAGMMGFKYVGAGSTSNYLYLGGHSVNDALVVQMTGNVGIGTANPGEKLDVNGNVLIGANNYLKTTPQTDAGQSMYSTFQRTSTSRGGYTMHGGGQTNALYIQDGYSETGGLAITNDDVTIFGAGDAGYIFRVIDEDRAAEGAVMQINQDNGAVYLKNNVGIGTASPGAKLDVQGGIFRVGGALSGLSIPQSELNINIRNSNGTDESPRILGYITGSTGDSGSDLAFNVTNSHEASGTERMRIKYNGNVGIGTTNPSSKLHLYNTSADSEFRITADGSFDTWFRMTGENNATTEGFTIQYDNSVGDVYLNQVYTGITGTTPAMRFSTGNTANAMVIAGGGNVGIGTANPREKIDVAGTLRAGSDGKLTMYSVSGGGCPECGTETVVLQTTIDDRTVSDGLPYVDESRHILSLQPIHGRVGIGTASPGNKLTINTTTNDTIPSLGSNGGSFGFFKNDGASGGNYGLLTGILSNGNVFSQVQRIDGIASVYNLLLQPSGGNVGIGTTNPTLGTLQVNGTIAAADSTGAYSVSINSNTSWGYLNSSLPIYVSNALWVDTGNIGSYNENLSLNTAGTTRMTIQNSDGNVGIGTALPGEKLDIAGNLKLSGLIKTAALTTGSEIIYIRGTGLNNNANRIVKIGNNTLVDTNGRGLTLTIITATTHALVSSTNYDTYATPADSTSLATALNNLQRSQIGILTSWDAWEGQVNDSLRSAANRLGLFKLAAYSAGGSRRPYAAIFYGSGTSTGNSEPGRQATEVMQTDDADAPYAIITTWFTEDGFTDAGLPSALISPDSETVNPVLMVNSAGNVGIGTTNPGWKLEVNGDAAAAKFVDRANSTYFLFPANSDSTNNSLSLYKTGSIRFNFDDVANTNPVIGAASRIQGFSNGLLMAVGTGSTAAGQTVTGWDNQLFLNNSGRVGIGTTSPSYNLQVQQTSTSPAMMIGGGYYGNPRLQVYGLDADSNAWMGLGTDMGGGPYELSIYTSNYSGNGKITFGTYNGSTYNQKMVMLNNGNFGIGTASPDEKLTVSGAIRTTSNAVGFGTQNSGLVDYYANNMRIVGAGSAGQTVGMQFFTTSSGTISESMRILGSGNVGIGTVSPGAKLEVNGNVYIGGATGINQQSGSYSVGSGIREMFRVPNLNLTTSGMFTISATRGSFVHTSQWAWSSNHHSLGRGMLTQISSGNYSNITIYLDVAGDGSAIISADWGDAQTYSISIQKNSGGALDLSAVGTDWTSVNAGYTRVRTLSTLSYGFQTDNGVFHGNVGIGISNPTAKLEIGGASSTITNTSGDISINSTSNNITFSGDNLINISDIYASGNIGIGVSTGAYKLQVNGQPAANGYTTFTNYSDAQLKENINYLSSGYLDKIMQLKPSTFNYNKLTGFDTVTQQRTIAGFVAQDIQKVFPEMVGHSLINGTDYLDVNLSALQIYTIRAMQEQQDQISDLSAQTAKLADLSAQTAKLSADLTITKTGNVAIGYNVSESTLKSLGYDGYKNEIEAAQYRLVDSANSSVNSIAQFGQIIVGKIKTGLLQTTNLIADNLVSQKIVTQDLTSDTLISGHITSTEASISGTLTTDKLISHEATISTLYAENIISKDGSITDVMAEKISSLRDEMRRLITQTQDSTPSAILAESQNWTASIATDSASLSGDMTLTNNLIVGAKLTVQGDTQLGNAFITGTFTTGEIAIKDNFIETTNTALYIQPSKTGSVHILGDTLVIADTGEVTINGNVAISGKISASEASISGSLIANLMQAQEASFDKLTTAELISEKLTSDKLNIATGSATIIAQSGFAQLATSSAELSSNATAGTATLPAGKTELIIHTQKLTSQSMVYLTPNGSTQNQVVYVKSKFICNSVETRCSASLPQESTSSSQLTSESSFTIALDKPLTTDVQINWWVIN